MTAGPNRAAGSEPLTVADYAALARRTLPREVWDFIAGGAGAERTVAANEAAFDAEFLRTRTLTGITAPSTSARILGDTWRAPLGVAPLAYHELAHHDGEVGTAKAAGDLGLPVVVSTFASRSVERIGAAASAPLWLQLYCFRDWWSSSDGPSCTGLRRAARWDSMTC